MRNKTYKQNGFGATPTSMQTHNPYGGERWTNSNLTETESTLLNWVGKEKDNESKLGDHGVRKYEYETGRFISIDPLWSNYYGWTPYQYSMNSPVMMVDYGGLKPIYHNNGYPNKVEEAVNSAVNFISANNPIAGLYLNYYMDKNNTAFSINFLSKEGQHRDGIKNEVRVNATGTSANFYWDPTTAFTTSDGKGISPATAFWHEFNHMLFEIMYKETSAILKHAVTNDNWSDLEEYRTITGNSFMNTSISIGMFSLFRIPSENEISKNNGEGVRDCHDCGEYYEVDSPTDTKPKGE